MALWMEITGGLMFGVCILSLYLSVSGDAILNPINIFLQSMSIPYILIVISNEKISLMTTGLFLLTVASFCIGGTTTLYLTSKFRIDIGLPDRKSKLFARTPVLAGLTSIGVLGLILGFFNAYFRSQMGPGNLFFNLRYMRTVEGVELGPEKYLSLALTLGAVFAVVSGRKRLAAFLALGWMSTAIWTMSRTAFLRPLVTVSVAYILAYNVDLTKIRNLSKLVGAAVLGVFGFLIGGIATGKTTSIIGHLSTYLIGPLLRFDSTVVGAHCPTAITGRQTFYIITRVTRVFEPGLRLNYQDCVPTSPTYSFLGIPYLDYGIIGTIFVPCLIAVGYTWLYRYAQNNNPYCISLYSLLVFPLVFSFYIYAFTITQNVYYFALVFTFWAADLIRTMAEDTDSLTESTN